MTKTSLKQKAYRHIRSKLLTQELKPGTPLSHRELAREIGISFTPVRDAIGQLANEGLLETHATRGTFVAEMSREDIAELYDVREALECHAVVKAAGRLGDTDSAELERYTAEMEAVADEVRQDESRRWSVSQNDRFMVADAAFHVALLRIAGNRRALRTVNELRVMASIFGHRKEERPQDSLESICGQHRRLIEALRRGDAALARDVLAEHLQRGCRRALAAYDRNRLAEADGRDGWMTYPAELQGRIQRMQDATISSKPPSET